MLQLEPHTSDLKLPTESSCPSRLMACLKALGQVQNSVWQQISSLQCEFGPSEMKSIITLFVSRFYNVFLCAALLLSQRTLPPVHCTPLQLSSRLPNHLALSTSVGKSFTSLCLNWLSNLPLDCELPERHLFIVNSQRLVPRLVQNKCPVNV